MKFVDPLDEVSASPQFIDPFDADIDEPKVDEFSEMVEKNKGVSFAMPPKLPENIRNGFNELLAMAGTGAIAKPLAGVAGVGEAINPLSPEGSAAGVVDSVKEAIEFKPGPDALAAIEYLKSGLPDVEIPDAIKSVVSAVKDSPDAVADQFGPTAGAVAKALPSAIDAVAAFKAASLAAGVTDDVAGAVFRGQSETKAKIAKMITEGVPDPSTAKFKVDAPNITPTISKALAAGGPRVVKDASAIRAIKQGFDPGVVAVIKGSSRIDRAKMLKMANILAKGKRDAKYAVTNRPSDVAGQSLMSRVRVVRNANREAGQRLDSVAQSLKGKVVDPSGPVNNFLSKLDALDIKVGPDLKPIFKDSGIEGVTGAEKVISNIMRRMANTKAPDAHDVHRLKKYIDEQVNFGARTEGLSGKTEGILKELRHDLDQLLDANFPAYNKVNTQFSETKGVLDAIQDIAGKKTDLGAGSAGSATGTLLRRLMSNAQSRTRLLDSIRDIESTAKKYSKTPIKDDLITQVMFSDELDSVFGAVARTSLKGQVEQGVKKAGQTFSGGGGVTGLAIDLTAKGLEKARGINEANALKAVRQLLRDSSSFAKKR